MRIFFYINFPHFSSPDLQTVSEAIPEITSEIGMPDLKHVLEFFSIRFGSSESSSDQKLSEGMKSLTNKLSDIRVSKE